MPDDFKPSQYEEHKKNIGNKRKKSEEEELKKNKDFAQLYTHNIDVIIQLIALNRLAGEILLLFIKFMQKNNTIIIEQKEIQAILNIKRRASVSEAIKYWWIMVM